MKKFLLFCLLIIVSLCSCTKKENKELYRIDKVYYIEDLSTSKLQLNLKILVNPSIYLISLNKENVMNDYFFSYLFEEDGYKAYMLTINFKRVVFTLQQLTLYLNNEKQIVDFGTYMVKKIPESSEDIYSDLNFEKKDNQYSSSLFIKNDLNHTIYITKVSSYLMPPINYKINDVMIGESYIYAYDCKSFSVFSISNTNHYVNGSGFLKMDFISNTKSYSIYIYFTY